MFSLTKRYMMKIARRNNKELTKTLFPCLSELWWLNYSLGLCRSFTTSPIKPEQKKEYQKIIIKPEDLEFQQVKGGGPGGQSVNKTNNCIILKHKPSGIVVKSHSSRDTETNRHYAIKQLKEKLDEAINGSLSKKSQAATKQRKQDSKRRKRSLEKYGDTSKKDTKQLSNEEAQENNDS